MNVWASLMVLAGGMFAGGAATFAWSRVPIWRRMSAQPFLADFAQTLARTDKVQPALLVAAIVSSAAFALTSDGSARILAILGAGGFAFVLAGSVAVLVPLQRRIIAMGRADPTSVEPMRLQWFRGNLGRVVVSTMAFAAVASASAI